MRLASIIYMLLLGLSAGDALAGLVETARPVTLSVSQRTAVEKVACANSPGKTAIGAQGYRGVLHGHHELTARVQCDDGIELDAYHAYFERYCIKRVWRWSCEDPPQIRLHMNVAGAGPYEIRLDKVSLDDALRSMSCLETALAQNPQVLNGFMAEHFVWVSAIELKPESLTVYLEAHDECYWIDYPRQCKVDAPNPLPVSISTGCFFE
jgi:hypothetical protein